MSRRTTVPSLAIVLRFTPPCAARATRAVSWRRRAECSLRVRASTPTRPSAPLSSSARRTRRRARSGRSSIASSATRARSTRSRSRSVTTSRASTRTRRSRRSRTRTRAASSLAAHGAALCEYAGAGANSELLKLLEPVSRAAESCAWLKAIVNSGEIFHLLRWTPSEAMRLLSDVEPLEQAGVVVCLSRPSPRPPAVTVGRKPTGLLVLFRLAHDLGRVEVDVAGREGIADEEIVGQHRDSSSRPSLKLGSSAVASGSLTDCGTTCPSSAAIATLIATATWAGPVPPDAHFKPSSPTSSRRTCGSRSRSRRRTAPSGVWRRASPARRRCRRLAR